MLDAPHLVVAAVAMLVGSTVASTVGFGLGITVSPVLLFVLDPQTVVILINVVGTAVFATILVRSLDHLKLREVGPMAGAGLLGVPFGVLALSSVSASALRIGIAALILVLAVVVAANPIGRMKASGALAPPLGFVVGAMTASLGVGAPLVVLFLLQHGWPPQTMRASLSLFNFLVMIASVAGYCIAGLLTADRVALLVVVAAPVAVGYVLGGRLVSRMNEQAFRKGTVGLISVTSLMILGRELLAL